jgi:phosphate transport system substrate-binding protein
MKWSDVDPAWPDEPFTLFQPGKDSGTFNYFTETIVGEENASRNDVTQSEDDNLLVTGVRTNTYGLGYFGFAYYHENMDSLRALAVREDSGSKAVMPTFESIRSAGAGANAEKDAEKYLPLTREIFLYVNKDVLAQATGGEKKENLKNQAIQDFLIFYLENAAEQSKAVGFVPLGSKSYEDSKTMMGLK